MAFVVAVDSGGTFSDCVVVTPQGEVLADKAPSTPPDYSVGILESVRLVAEKLGLTLTQLLSQTAAFAHGTTVATNTMVTRSGARVGLLTTLGHEDALIVGRCIQKVAGLSEEEMIRVVQLDKPEPLVPRRLIRGVPERVDSVGKVVVPIDRAISEDLVRELVRSGVEAVAVSLLWSFLNPAHEEWLGQIVRGVAPDLFLSLSSRVAPVIKEYERTATTVVNAYLAPRTSTYLKRLAGRLQESGLGSAPLIMQSSGGVTDAATAWELPVSLLSSGPSGGVVAAKQLGGLLGHANILTLDMGGTSFDVGLILDSEEEMSEAPIFSQMPILYPMIDVTSIGAGGGSIAWFDEMTGTMKVGPQSAGADPGPASYGRGGTEPTVTDANVVLGRIDPDFFLGGRTRLDAGAARRAVEKVAARLRLSVEESALGIIEIMNARMEDLIRKVTVGRGRDPRDFVAYAFGGATGLHIADMMAGLGVGRTVIPRQAAVFSAFGIATSDFVRTGQLSAPMVAPLDLGRLNHLFRELEEELSTGFAALGVPRERLVIKRYVDVRFRGQVHEVRVPVPRKELVGEDEPALMSAFEERYEAKYGRGTAYKEAGLELRTLLVRVEGSPTRPPVATEAPEQDPDPATARKGSRPVYFRKRGWIDTPIFDAERLGPGMVIAGPAIVEAPDTTVLADSSQRLEVDRYLNLIMIQKERSEL